ncbi:MAG: J domain-containing protein [Pseudomonadota bacterium]
MRSRSNNWGFPRWGGYGAAAEPATVRLCDRIGCTARGAHPAPKSPNSSARWWFCEAHAAEYNHAWDYFAGLSAEEAARRREEDAGWRAHARSSAWAWMGPSGASAREQAFGVLELDATASQEEVKRAYRRLAKKYHPDTNAGDAEATKRFHDVRAAYDLLQTKEGEKPS